MDDARDRLTVAARVAEVRDAVGASSSPAARSSMPSSNKVDGLRAGAVTSGANRSASEPPDLNGLGVGMASRLKMRAAQTRVRVRTTMAKPVMPTMDELDELVPSRPVKTSNSMHSPVLARTRSGHSLASSVSSITSTASAPGIAVGATTRRLRRAGGLDSSPITLSGAVSTSGPVRMRHTDGESLSPQMSSPPGHTLPRRPPRSDVRRGFEHEQTIGRLTGVGVRARHVVARPSGRGTPSRVQAIESKNLRSSSQSPPTAGSALSQSGSDSKLDATRASPTSEYASSASSAGDSVGSRGNARNSRSPVRSRSPPPLAARGGAGGAASDSKWLEPRRATASLNLEEGRDEDRVGSSPELSPARMSHKSPVPPSPRDGGASTHGMRSFSSFASKLTGASSAADMFGLKRSTSFRSSRTGRSGRSFYGSARGGGSTVVSSLHSQVSPAETMGMTQQRVFRALARKTSKPSLAASVDSLLSARREFQVGSTSLKLPFLDEQAEQLRGVGERLDAARELNDLAGNPDDAAAAQLESAVHAYESVVREIQYHREEEALESTGQGLRTAKERRTERAELVKSLKLAMEATTAARRQLLARKDPASYAACIRSRTGLTRKQRADIEEKALEWLRTAASGSLQRLQQVAASSQDGFDGGRLARRRRLAEQLRTAPRGVPSSGNRALFQTLLAPRLSKLTEHKAVVSGAGSGGSSDEGKDADGPNEELATKMREYLEDAIQSLEQAVAAHEHHNRVVDLAAQGIMPVPDGWFFATGTGGYDEDDSPAPSSDEVALFALDAQASLRRASIYMLSSARKVYAECRRQYALVRTMHTALGDRSTPDIDGVVRDASAALKRASDAKQSLTKQVGKQAAVLNASAASQNFKAVGRVSASKAERFVVSVTSARDAVLFARHFVRARDKELREQAEAVKYATMRREAMREITQQVMSCRKALVRAVNTLGKYVKVEGAPSASSRRPARGSSEDTSDSALRLAVLESRVSGQLQAVFPELDIPMSTYQLATDYVSEAAALAEDAVAFCRAGSDDEHVAQEFVVAVQSAEKVLDDIEKCKHDFDRAATERRRAATLIQSVWRGCVQRSMAKVAMAITKLQRKSAVIIQAVARGHIARRYLANKAAVDGATTIQSVVRMRLARFTLERLRIEEKQAAAAIVIQKHIRSRLARNAMSEMRHLRAMDLAAVQIQRLGRSLCARKIAQRLWDQRMGKIMAILTDARSKYREMRLQLRNTEAQCKSAGEDLEAAGKLTPAGGEKSREFNIAVDSLSQARRDALKARNALLRAAEPLKEGTAAVNSIVNAHSSGSHVFAARPLSRIFTPSGRVGDRSSTATPEPTGDATSVAAKQPRPASVIDALAMCRQGKAAIEKCREPMERAFSSANRAHGDIITAVEAQTIGRKAVAARTLQRMVRGRRARLTTSKLWTTLIREFSKRTLSASTMLTALQGEADEAVLRIEAIKAGLGVRPPIRGRSSRRAKLSGPDAAEALSAVGLAERAIRDVRPKLSECNMLLGRATQMIQSLSTRLGVGDSPDKEESTSRHSGVNIHTAREITQRVEERVEELQPALQQTAAHIMTAQTAARRAVETEKARKDAAVVRLQSRIRGHQVRRRLRVADAADMLVNAHAVMAQAKADFATLLSRLQACEEIAGLCKRATEEQQHTQEMIRKRRSAATGTRSADGDAQSNSEDGSDDVDAQLREGSIHSTVERAREAVTRAQVLLQAALATQAELPEPPASPRGGSALSSAGVSLAPTRSPIGAASVSSSTGFVPPVPLGDPFRRSAAGSAANSVSMESVSPRHMADSGMMSVASADVLPVGLSSTSVDPFADDRSATSAGPARPAGAPGTKLSVAIPSQQHGAQEASGSPRTVPASRGSADTFESRGAAAGTMLQSSIADADPELIREFCRLAEKLPSAIERAEQPVAECVRACTLKMAEVIANAAFELSMAKSSLSQVDKTAAKHEVSSAASVRLPLHAARDHLDSSETMRKRLLAMGSLSLESLDRARAFLDSVRAVNAAVTSSKDAVERVCHGRVLSEYRTVESDLKEAMAAHVSLIRDLRSTDVNLENVPSHLGTPLLFALKDATKALRKADLRMPRSFERKSAPLTMERVVMLKRMVHTAASKLPTVAEAAETVVTSDESVRYRKSSMIRRELAGTVYDNRSDTTSVLWRSLNAKGISSSGSTLFRQAMDGRRDSNLTIGGGLHNTMPVDPRRSSFLSFGGVSGAGGRRKRSTVHLHNPRRSSRKQSRLSITLDLAPMAKEHEDRIAAAREAREKRRAERRRAGITDADTESSESDSDTTESTGGPLSSPAALTPVRQGLMRPLQPPSARVRPGNDRSPRERMVSFRLPSESLTGVVMEEGRPVKHMLRDPRRSPVLSSPESTFGRPYTTLWEE